MSERTRHAHETLVETWHNLDTLVDPAPAREEAAAQLDETIADLREEIRIAGNVRKRLLSPDEEGPRPGETGKPTAESTIGELFSAEPQERE